MGYHYDVVKKNEWRRRAESGFRIALRRVRGVDIRAVNLTLISPRTIFQSLRVNNHPENHSSSPPAPPPLRFNQMETKQKMMKRETFFLPLNVQWSEKGKINYLYAFRFSHPLESLVFAFPNSGAPHNCVTKTFCASILGKSQYPCFDSSLVRLSFCQAFRVAAPQLCLFISLMSW